MVNFSFIIGNSELNQVWKFDTVSDNEVSSRTNLDENLPQYFATYVKAQSVSRLACEFTELFFFYLADLIVENTLRKFPQFHRYFRKLYLKNDFNCSIHSSLLWLEHAIGNNRVSAVGITTGCGLDDKRDRSSSPSRVKNCLFSTSFRPVLGPRQPSFQWVTGSLSTGVKRPGCEANHSPPTSAEVKKTWIYTSTPPYFFMA
jgi:hypothetical protein